MPAPIFEHDVRESPPSIHARMSLEDTRRTS
jgi:hypothetical protein